MTILSALLTASCGGARAASAPVEPATIEPRSSGPASASISAADPNPADVAFMQAMIVHHAQALDMAQLVPERTVSEGVRLLARRIDQTQRYEIERMSEWLEERGQSVPDIDAARGADAAHHTGMAGMATPAQMERLASLRGVAFDRLFLELMIRHHQGALTMVANLLSSDGGGQDPRTYLVIGDIDADQRAEIARMQRMLNTLQ